MQSAAIYARVSTSEQDVQRQLDECREHIDSKFPDVEDVDVYADIISGADEHGGEQYRQLCDAIEGDSYDLVVVHELSRLSRLGAGEIHQFIQHCMKWETAIESLDIGLSIRVDDPRLQRTVYTMVANIMGDLAKSSTSKNYNASSPGFEPPSVLALGLAVRHAASTSTGRASFTSIA